MIRRLQGELVEVTAEHALVRVAGVSYQIHVSPATRDLLAERVRAVVVGREHVQDVDRHLGAEMLPRVVQRVEQDLGLVLVDRDVVAHLGRPDVAPLIALAELVELHDVRVGGRHVVDVRDHLRIVVVPTGARREVGHRRVDD